MLTVAVPRMVATEMTIQWRLANLSAKNEEVQILVREKPAILMRLLNHPQISKTMPGVEALEMSQ